ncbi:hypothetical protein SSP35_02_01720 [Streptomyces sp. NBRC 110611]|uniref:DUF6081 family protein n=1 Tax=Streptomyces sp. NBRC 110611 TaxID=1621259 RepID=UPI000834DB63|nr:DUF6081 family protein [Streptomyces sp. NBRC 110611]GAU65805.1 hypothetical protein SSP35_02_01720 [Streptomyces sp. NBRC 110611]
MTATTTTSPSGRSRVIWADDFSDGFDTEGPGAKWAYLPLGPGVGHDGMPSTSQGRLRVVAGGTNPRTGEPAFTHTVGQHDPGKLPGTLDHVKWLVYANQHSSGGILGFDTAPGHELSCETRISGAVYGTRDHPFEDAVVNPDDDPRLAMVALALQDPETDVAFEFALTNESVHVLYERLPNARAQLGNYASFLHAVPVASRTPCEEHHVRISYDRSAGLARWFLDGREVFRVDRVGCRLPSRRYLVTDHGGTEGRVEPRQLACGMGMFNFLDGTLPGRPGSGLVRLSGAPDFYFDPVTGEPDPLAFLDDASLASHRLFGQGAELRMGRFTVSSKRTGTS